MNIKNILVSEKEISTIDMLFKDLNVITIDNYLNPHWGVLYFHSKPFFEKQIYSCLLSLIENCECTGINIFCHPLNAKSDFLKIEKMPEKFEEFDGLMTTKKYIYTGGFGYDEKKRFAFVSCADTEVFSIGFDPSFISQPLVKCIKNSLAISREQASILVQKHLNFLRGE